jgi:thiol-disulfide isomerase/thioredoxin
MRRWIVSLMVAGVTLSLGAQGVDLTLSVGDSAALSHQARQLYDQAVAHFDRADNATGIGLLNEAATLEPQAISLQLALAAAAEDCLENCDLEEKLLGFAEMARQAYQRILDNPTANRVHRLRAERGLERVNALLAATRARLGRRLEGAGSYLTSSSVNQPTRPGEGGRAAAAGGSTTGGLRRISSVSQFNGLVNGSALPVLIDFGAEWCPPCRQMKPEIRSLAGERRGSLLVLEVDGDDHRSLIRRFGVDAYPTLVLMRNGREVARTVGGRSKAALAQFVDANS